MVAAEGQFTLHFTATGQVTGQGACNRLMGDYSTTADRSLKIGPLASTRRLCGDNREQEFLTTLDQATHYEMDGPMLLLLSNGNLTAIFDSQAAGNN